MNLTQFFTELKRRNVYKVAAAYAVVGWLLIQVATQVFPFLDIANWVIRLVILLVAIGFPVALFIAWAFELTPEGIKRTDEADADHEHSIGGTWIYVAIVGALLSVALFFAGRYTARSEAKALPELTEKSIAVLPFDNLSHDPENAFFAEGIQDEILTRLAKVADLKVISRTSTERFKSAPADLRQIAQQLGVTNIVEGSVQRAGDEVRVNVQLINAVTDTHLWAEIYDRKLTDIFAVESDIAKRIAETLQAKLTGKEKQLIAVQPTADPQAHELFLLGRFFAAKRTADDLHRALKYFEEATTKDPKFALAYAGMADAYALLPLFAGGTPTDIYPKAEEAARQALALDPTLAEPHATLGLILCVFDFDQRASIREFETAIKLNPNYAPAHHWLANAALPCVGQFDRAIAEIKRARELDPLSVIINTDVGVAYAQAGRFDEGIAQMHAALDMDPRFYYAHWNLGAAYEWKGDLQSALAEYARAVALDEDPYPLGLLGGAKAKAGDRAGALAILQRLHDEETKRYVPQYCFALIHLDLGERDRALDFLEASYRLRQPDLNSIRYDRFLEPLKGDPRFEALVQKITAPKQ